MIIFKVGVLKNCALITRKYLCWSLFLINLPAWMIESYWNSLVCLVGLILGIISKAIENCIIAFLDPLNRMEKLHAFNIHWVLEKTDLLILIGWMVKNQKQLSEVLCQKCVLKNFVKFTGKHLRPATLLKKRLWFRCLPVNLAKFL